MNEWTISNTAYGLYRSESAPYFLFFHCSTVMSKINHIECEVIFEVNVVKANVVGHFSTDTQEQQLQMVF